MKTTFLKKLLIFVIPLSLAPLMLMMLFYYLYLNKVIQAEVIGTQKTLLPHLSSHIETPLTDMQEFSEHLQDYKVIFQKLALYDAQMKEVYKSYDTTDTDISMTEKEVKRLFQNQDSFTLSTRNDLLIQRVIRDNATIAYIVVSYKDVVEAKMLIMKQTMFYLFFIILFIGLIISIFIVIFSLKLLEPMSLLVQGIKKISAGDLNVSIDNSSNDEIGLLVDAFNEMTLKRKLVEDKLKYLNEDLQNRVDEKTLELRGLNNSLEEKITLATQEIQKQGALLIQQSRLAQMGEMISMIAHQWRQPLASISAISGTLSLDTMMDNYEKKFFTQRLDSISELSQHLSSTIDDFRNFYCPTKEKRKTTMDDIVIHALKIIEASLYNSEIELVCKYDSQGLIEMYDNEIMQVILNILKNAQDNFLERKTVSPKIRISTYKDSIEICDNGGGIRDTLKAKIFDPYFSTKKEKDGTGLGLYMSKIIIEEHHNGILKVENTTDQIGFPIGVCFTISIH